MLFIRQLKPSLNVQNDCIRAKVVHFHTLCSAYLAMTLLLDIHFVSYLDNGVMTIPKRRLLSFVFSFSFSML